MSAQVLLAHYEDSPPQVREAGRAWYPNARVLCQAIGGDAVPVDTVARVMAILSPRTSWRWNVRWTQVIVDAFLHGEAMPAVSTMANRLKAWSELHGKPALSGQKASAFARAIVGDSGAVVIDSWVLRSVGLSPKKTVTRHRQRWITSAYVEAALLAGETPRDMQAIVWCAVRGATT